MDPAATALASSCRGLPRAWRLLVSVAAALSLGAGYVHGSGVAAGASSVKQASTCSPKKRAPVQKKAKRKAAKKQPAIEAKAAGRKRTTAATCAPVSKHRMTSKRRV
jgi:hypothetical protein